MNDIYQLIIKNIREGCNHIIYECPFPIEYINISINFDNFAICKKCNYKNEYMSHDPEYVCFNCR